MSSLLDSKNDNGVLLDTREQSIPHHDDVNDDCNNNKNNKNNNIVNNHDIHESDIHHHQQQQQQQQQNNNVKESVQLVCSTLSSSSSTTTTTTPSITPSTSTSPSPSPSLLSKKLEPKFQLKQKVLSEDNFKTKTPILYPATILNVMYASNKSYSQTSLKKQYRNIIKSNKNDNNHNNNHNNDDDEFIYFYYVHYKGWSNKFDRWIPEHGIHEDNEVGRMLKQQMEDDLNNYLKQVKETKKTKVTSTSKSTIATKTSSSLSLSSSPLTITQTPSSITNNSAELAHRASGKRRRTQYNPHSWSTSTLSRRSKVLLLGMSYPCTTNQIESENKLQSKFDLDYIESSVEQAVELVRRNILTQMDGRDLARILALESSNDTHVYTASLEQGAIYNQRHMTSNFNRTTFCSDVKTKFGKDIQFRQIILDYFWIPNGTWQKSHWTSMFFKTTLVNFVKYKLLDFDEGLYTENDVGIFSTSGKGGGVVYLPFCLHCMQQLIANLDDLSKYYTIDFVYKHELDKHALWAATNTIDPDTMQHYLGKALNQEDYYCMITPSDVYGSGTETNVTKEEVLDILRRINDFYNVRMIKLKVLQIHNPDYIKSHNFDKNCKTATSDNGNKGRRSGHRKKKVLGIDKGGFVGLETDACQVKYGFDRKDWKQCILHRNNVVSASNINGKSKKSDRDDDNDEAKVTNVNIVETNDAKNNHILCHDSTSPLIEDHHVSQSKIVQIDSGLSEKKINNQVQLDAIEVFRCMSNNNVIEEEKKIDDTNQFENTQ